MMYLSILILIDSGFGKKAKSTEIKTYRNAKSTTRIKA